MISTEANFASHHISASSATSRAVMHPLIPDMLSELAFNREVGDPPSQPSTFSSNKNKSASQSFLSSWSGLFCLTFEDPDMFYDAEEMIHGHNGQVHTDGKGTRPAPARATSSKIAVLCRGGSDNNYFCWPRDDVSHLHSPVNMNHLNRNKNWSDCEGDRSRAPDVAPFPPHRKIHNSMNDSFHSANGSMRHICDFNLPPHNSFQPNPSMASMISSADEIYSQPVEIDSYGRVYSHDKHHSSPPPPTPSQQQANGRISTVSSSLSAQALPSHNPFTRILPPPAPQELPSRFLRAGKGDPVQGRRRYEATLAWRKEHGIDTLLLQAHPHFELIKKHYPHYYHLTGRNGEPVFFEQPPKTDLQALKAGGINLDLLVRHYTMVTEFQWQYIERDDHAQSITVLDLDGIRMIDFVGDCVEYVKKCSHFTGQHYPERAGHVIVINVPRWFSMIWSVVKPMVDEVTLKKISIVRGKEEIYKALLEKIPEENIPPEYGGKSTMKLGETPQEQALRGLMAHNNALANGDFSCGGRAANPPCPFCSFGPVRSY